jgi:hypothetical protein
MARLYVAVRILCAGALGACSIHTGGLGGDGGPDAGEAGVDARADDGGGLDGGFDTGPPPDAGCHEIAPAEHLITLDRDDFGAADAEHRGTAVERPGLLVIPAQPFRHGALLARGYDGALLGDPPALSDLSTSPAGHAFLGDLNQSWSGSDAPEGLLVAERDRYTLAADGEIRLLAGVTTLDFEPDDHGVVEIDVGGTTYRAVAPNATTRGRVTFTVPTDRWAPIRFAYSDTGADSRLRVYLARDGGARAVPGPDVLRADVRSPHGREVLGFDRAPADSDVDGARIDPDSTDQSWGSGRPAGLGITNDDTWSLRWLARWTFDVPDGTMRADTDGKHRLWVHGVYYGGEYATGTADATYDLRLAPGTNDVVYELDEMLGSAFTRSYVNGDIAAAERMRPATRFGGVAFGAGSPTTSRSIGAGSTEAVDVDVSAPAVPAATVVEISGVIDTAEPDAITLQYTSPGGGDASAPLRDWGEPAAGDRWVFRTVVPAPAGGTGGRWRVGVRNDGGSTATLIAAGVLGHHGADPEPYAGTATFVSAPQDLGIRTRITSVEIDAYMLFHTRVELSVAAADDSAGLASPWWYPVAGDGTVDGPVGRWAIVRAVLEGPRVDTPRIVEIRTFGGACVP